ncbi:MAG: hypothetical protein JW760_00875 [Spirochaetales bacterium]|nr:hypothetical protein [Spirochaetales bacterium]
MLAPQLITGTVVFFSELLSGSRPPEPVYALFLLFLILVSGGFLSSRFRIRFPLLVLKAVFCAGLASETPLSLLLLPFIGMELPEFLRPALKTAAFWILSTGITALPAFFLPRAFLIPFAGLWAAAVFLAFREGQRNTEAGRLRSRTSRLEQELTQSEAARTRTEQAGAMQESLAGLEERDRLTRLLHDQLGHAMTGSIMQLEAAALLFDDEPERAREILQRVSAALKEGLEGVRSNLKAVKPEPFQLGEQRLRKLLKAFERDYNLAAELILQGPIQGLPVHLWQIIEDNLTEALTNMLRHSSGRRFTCRIEALNRVYKVEFRDDGEVKSPVRPGMGLEGMETRVREAGGTIIVDTSRGFSIIMLFQKGES